MRKKSMSLFICGFLLVHVTGVVFMEGSNAVSINNQVVPHVLEGGSQMLEHPATTPHGDDQPEDLTPWLTEEEKKKLDEEMRNTLAHDEPGERYTDADRAADEARRNMSAGAPQDSTQSEDLTPWLTEEEKRKIEEEMRNTLAHDEPGERYTDADRAADEARRNMSAGAPQDSTQSEDLTPWLTEEEKRKIEEEMRNTLAHDEPGERYTDADRAADEARRQRTMGISSKNSESVESVSSEIPGKSRAESHLPNTGETAQEQLGAYGVFMMSVAGLVAWWRGSYHGDKTRI